MPAGPRNPPKEDQLVVVTAADGSFSIMRHNAEIKVLSIGEADFLLANLRTMRKHLPGAVSK